MRGKNREEEKKKKKILLSFAYTHTHIISSVTHKQTLEIKRCALPCYDDGHVDNETLSVEKKRKLRAFMCARIFLFLQCRMV